MLDLRINGEVKSDTPGSVAAFLEAARGAPVRLVVNSPGGNAFAGAAIYGQLRAYRGRISAVVEGLAASSASLILMAADEVLIHEGSFIMVHAAWMETAGNAADLRQRADLLEKVSGTFLRAYAERTKRSEEEVSRWMAEETWFSAEEAVAAGLADRVLTPLRVAACLDLTKFRNPPAALVAALKESFMPNDLANVAAAANPAPDINTPATLAEVEQIAGHARLGADFVLSQIKAGANVAAVREAAIEALAAARGPAITPLGAVILTDHTSPAELVQRMTGAVVARFRRAEPDASAREFAGSTLAGMAEVLLKARGLVPHSRRLSDAEAIQMALTTSDFPNLLRGTSQRLLAQRMAATPGAARMVCAPRSVRDFREFKLLQFAGVPNLHELAEGGSIEHAPPSERAEASAVKTFARAMRWTRQALVNDDLDALTQVNLLANAVIATEGAEFVKLFAANGGGFGPTMSDGNPLFIAAHSNVATGAMGTSGLGAARLVMRGQVDAAGTLIAPTPRYLVVSPTNETAAEQALNELMVASAESARPVFANRLDLLLEPRISGTPYYLFADPAEAAVAAFVTLEGSNGQPRFTEHETAKFDGVEFKLTHDFVIAPMGWVGAVRSTGA